MILEVKGKKIWRYSYHGVIGMDDMMFVVRDFVEVVVGGVDGWFGRACLGEDWIRLGWMWVWVLL